MAAKPTLMDSLKLHINVNESFANLEKITDSVCKCDFLGSFHIYTVLLGTVCFQLQRKFWIFGFLLKPALVA